MAAKKAKGKAGARKSGLDGAAAMARLTALRTQLASLLDRLIAAEKALADALRAGDGSAPATRTRTARTASAARKRTTASARRTATRTRSTASRSGG